MTPSHCGRSPCVEPEFSAPAAGLSAALGVIAADFSMHPVAIVVMTSPPTITSRYRISRVKLLAQDLRFDAWGSGVAAVHGGSRSAVGSPVRPDVVKDPPGASAQANGHY